jgi:uncharacterized protein YceH (UPF0502 family)
MSENIADALPQLDATEARVLGCLIEKAALTPEVYPMTVNALVTAANQKTSREPVLSLEPGEVGHCLRKLEDRGFVKVVHSARALRYEHRFDEVYGVTSRQRAVLCLLLLRGPQTLAELFSRSDRLADFDSADAVREILERLSARNPAMVVNLGRAAGQREDRYMHLLCGPVSAEAYATSAAERPVSRGELEQRIEKLEAEVAELKRRLDALA